MRKVLAVLLFMGLSMSPAKADTQNPKVINSSIAEEDLPSIPFYEPAVLSSGDSSANLAYEFSLTNETDVHSILLPVAVINGLQNHTPVPGTWSLNMSLYSGSSHMVEGDVLPNGEVIPNINNRLFNEQFNVVSLQVQPNDVPTFFSFQGVDDVNLDLPPGDYWVGVLQGEGVAFVKPDLELVSTPEPPVWVFFVLMAGFILWRERKKAAEMTDKGPIV
jgi:hypothetical protein